MDSDNGKTVHVSKILQEAEKALERSDSRLLESWKDTHPALRAVVLGAEYASEKWAAGTISFRRDGHDVLCVLRIDDYGLQAVFRDSEIHSLLDTIEWALANKGVPWDKTYQEKKKDKDRIAQARKVS